MLRHTDLKNIPSGGYNIIHGGGLHYEAVLLEGLSVCNFTWGGAMNNTWKTVTNTKAGI